MCVCRVTKRKQDRAPDRVVVLVRRAARVAVVPGHVRAVEAADGRTLDLAAAVARAPATVVITTTRIVTAVGIATRIRTITTVVDATRSVDTTTVDAAGSTTTTEEGITTGPITTGRTTTTKVVVTFELIVELLPK